MEIHFGKKDGVKHLGPIFSGLSIGLGQKPMEQFTQEITKAVERDFADQNPQGVHNVTLAPQGRSGGYYIITGDVYTLEA